MCGCISVVIAAVFHRLPLETPLIDTPAGLEHNESHRVVRKELPAEGVFPPLVNMERKEWVWFVQEGPSMWDDATHFYVTIKGSNEEVYISLKT